MYAPERARASRRKRFAATSGLAIVAACAMLSFSGAAYAQDETADEEIVVTGSRIARPANIDAPTQVTTIGQEQIEQSGLTNVADILRTVPSFGVPALSTTNSNFLTSGAGVNTLQLRNLGEDRTLVLVNGRRQVSGVPGSAAVDFNTIPVQMIERVEVITGGASAIYGSDALAGVINVILRDDFEGVEFGYQYGQSGEGDLESHAPYVLAGSNFAEGRGNLTMLVSYDQQGAVYSRDRDRTQVDDIALCLLTDIPADCQTELAPFYSGFGEFGRFIIPSVEGQEFTVSTGIGPDGAVVPFDSDLFGFNRQALRTISVPTERFLVAANMRYEFTPNIEGYLEATYASTNTTSRIEPFPLGNEDIGLTGISIDNPFVPEDIRDAAIAAGDTEIGFARRLTEIGNRGTSGERELTRVVLGARGDVFSNWRWDAYYSYGETRQHERSTGDVSVPRFQAALDAVDLDGNPATTDDIVCADPVAVAEGCVPINLFGLGSISPEAADYVRLGTERHSNIRQDIVGATISGPVFEMPAGPLSAVVGIEHRREEATDIPDPAVQAGLVAGNIEQVTSGEYDVTEGFIEIEAPLVRDLPFANEITVGAAYRYSDYSTIGETEAYTGRISWEPIESLRFRAQYARAVRAPNIGELFAPAGENFAPVADPCNGVTAATPGVVADNCRSIPEIAARIAATGSFTLTQAEIQGTGGFTGGGNPDLQPEIADSYNIGVVWDSDLGPGRLLASLDYYQIEIESVIDVIDRQQSLDLCFNSVNFPNEFCNALVRDAAGAAFQQGELLEVNSGFLNEGNLETSGIDFALAYTFPFEAGGWLSPGSELSLRANYTHLLDFEQTQFGTADDLAGEIGFSEDKLQAGAELSTGPLTVSWETTYFSDAKPDNDPASLFYFDVGEYIVHDLQVGWNVGDTGANIYFGVDNVFDEDPAVILSGVPGNTTGTDTNAGVYDPIGRRFYVGARLRL